MILSRIRDKANMVNSTIFPTIFHKNVFNNLYCMETLEKQVTILFIYCKILFIFTTSYMHTMKYGNI